MTLLVSASAGCKDTRTFAMNPFPELSESDLLFVKIDEEKSLAVIESVGKGIYMLTRLPDAIKMKAIRALTTSLPSASATGADFVNLERDFGKFWTRLAKPLPKVTSEHHALFNSFSMAPPSAARKSKSDMKSFSSPIKLTANTSCTSPASSVPVYKQEDGNPRTQHFSKDELTKHMTQAYYKALYISKSPLLFFTKLALTRFRGLCNDEPVQICEILKSMLLTVGEIDEKYKKGLRKKLNILEEEHGGEEIEGLGFNDEDEDAFVRRWWNLEEEVRKPKMWTRKINEMKRRE